MFPARLELATFRYPLAEFLGSIVVSQSPPITRETGASISQRVGFFSQLALVEYCFTC